MPARSNDSRATRAAILGAARLQFGRQGFERTTIRSVAEAAGVDPALVMHYFKNKDGLFAAVAQLDVSMPDLTGVAPDQVAAVIVPLFSRAWGPDGPLLPLLRAAATNPVAADALRDLFTRHVAPGLAVVAVDRAAERAALIGAHLVGVAVARSIIGTPPLADMDDETLADWLGPIVALYLTGPFRSRSEPSEPSEPYESFEASEPS